MSMLDMMGNSGYTGQWNAFGMISQLMSMCGGPQGLQNIIKQFTGANGQVDEEKIKQRIKQLNYTQQDVQNLKNMCLAFGAKQDDIDRIFNKYGLT